MTVMKVGVMCEYVVCMRSCVLYKTRCGVCVGVESICIHSLVVFVHWWVV